MIIASIEEPEVIAKILTDLEKIAPDRFQAELPLGGTLGVNAQKMMSLRGSSALEIGKRR